MILQQISRAVGSPAIAGRDLTYRSITQKSWLVL